MKQQILHLAITALVLSSCTTAYKTGQTPDDVYFSQAKPQDEYVQVDREKDRYRYNSDEYYDDRYLRMKVQNRTRWDYLDDWYAYDRYGYRYNYYYGSYFNPYTSWNYYYNPYCPSTVVAVNSKVPASQTSYEKPRNFNLNSYTNNNYYTVNNVTKGMSSKPGSVSRQVYNNSNNNGLSNTLNQIFSNGNNNNSYSAPTRSYNPSSGSSNNSSSAGSNSSGSSSGEVSRPKRGGN